MHSPAAEGSVLRRADAHFGGAFRGGLSDADEPDDDELPEPEVLLLEDVLGLHASRNLCLSKGTLLLQEGGKYSVQRVFVISALTRQPYRTDASDNPPKRQQVRARVRDVQYTSGPRKISTLLGAVLQSSHLIHLLCSVVALDTTSPPCSKARSCAERWLSHKYYTDLRSSVSLVQKHKSSQEPRQLHRAIWALNYHSFGG